jgi:hypothetical protein
MSVLTYKGIAMKKYKPKTVKFIFTPKLNRGNDWSKPTKPDYHFGNRYTEELNTYQYNRNHISVLFSDELENANDDRRFDKKATYTVNEAHILLLKYLEDCLKSARKEKRRLDTLEKIHTKRFDSVKDVNITVLGLGYAKTVNARELAHNLEAVKKYRKIVKEIKASPEYLWELLNK